MFTVLYQSTYRFFERFGFPQRPIEAVARVKEELAEFTAEVESGNREAALEEWTDLLVTVFGAAVASGFSYMELERAAQIVIAKNEAKTHQTHYVREDGKIARKNGSQTST